MKSAYELAMERLNKTSPSVKLTDAQKKELAELDARYAAKIAERELTLRDEAARLSERGEFDKAAEVQAQLISERKTLQAELESKKETVRERNRTK